MVSTSMELFIFTGLECSGKKTTLAFLAEHLSKANKYSVVSQAAWTVEDASAYVAANSQVSSDQQQTEEDEDSKAPTPCSIVYVPWSDLPAVLAVLDKHNNQVMLAQYPSSGWIGVGPLKNKNSSKERSGKSSGGPSAESSDSSASSVVQYCVVFLEVALEELAARIKQRAGDKANEKSILKRLRKQADAFPSVLLKTAPDLDALDTAIPPAEGSEEKDAPAPESKTPATRWVTSHVSAAASARARPPSSRRRVKSDVSAAPTVITPIWGEGEDGIPLRTGRYHVLADNLRASPYVTIVSLHATGTAEEAEGGEGGAVELLSSPGEPVNPFAAPARLEALNSLLGFDRLRDQPPPNPDLLAECTPQDYLKRTILPVLLPALERCERLRPSQPLAFIGMEMLRTNDVSKITRRGLQREIAQGEGISEATETTANYHARI